VAIVTLQQLDDRTRERADQVYASTITTTEIYTYINDGIRYVDDLLVRCYGEDYRATSVTFTATVGAENHSLSALTSGSFYKLLALSGVGSSGWQDCKPYNWRERNALRASGVVVQPGQTYRYKITGDNLSLLPVPTAATRMEIVWTPSTTALSSTTDTWNDVNGYSKLVVLKAAYAIKDKLEEDVSSLAAEIQAEEARIIAAAPSRDSGEPATVADVQGADAASAYPGNPLWWRT
jgi:hypothetical protein